VVCAQGIPALGGEGAGPCARGAPAWGGENRENMYYTYILYSKKLDKFYNGFTEDLKERFKNHNQGKVPFTSRGIPWQLVYYEAFLEKEDALREERFLKTGKGRERRKFLLSAFYKKIKN